jgi:MOSC domain-containing protein YiiM
LLVAPLSRLIASGQVKAGDVVTVRWRDDEPVFVRESSEPSKRHKAADKIVR